MKKVIVSFLIASTLLKAQAASIYPVTVTDDLGHTYTFTKEPRRIVVNHPEALELALVLGLQPVGYSLAPEGTQLNKPIPKIPRYDDLVKINPVYLGQPLNLEATAALKPDLIVLNNNMSPELVRQLQNIAPVMVLDFYKGKGWQQSIVPLSKVFGKEKRAQEILASVKQQETQARNQLAPAAARGKKVTIFAIIGKDTYSFGPDDFLSQQLQRLGFEVNGAFGKTMAPISLESILAAKSDKALLVSYTPQPQTQKDVLTMMKRAGFKDIYTLEPEKVSRFSAGPLSDVQLINYFVKTFSKPGIK